MDININIPKFRFCIILQLTEYLQIKHTLQLLQLIGIAF